MKLDLMKILQGSARFATVMEGSDPIAVVEFITVNRSDKTFEFYHDFMAFGYYRRYEIADSDYDVEAVKAVFYSFQNRIRRTIVNAARSVYQENLSREIEEKNEERAKRLKKMNAPHPEGTVAELMVFLGVSKSEVRRLRAEGKLDEAIALKKAENTFQENQE